MTHRFLHRSDFTEALETYRREQQTLTGLSLTQIEEGVLSIIRSKYPSKQVNKNILLLIEVSIFILFRRWILKALKMR
jgi:hypothetical protein